MSTSLRSRLIQAAHANPLLRPHLLPLLHRTAAALNQALSAPLYMLLDDETRAQPYRVEQTAKDLSSQLQTRQTQLEESARVAAELRKKMDSWIADPQLCTKASVQNAILSLGYLRR